MEPDDRDLISGARRSPTALALVCCSMSAVSSRGGEFRSTDQRSKERMHYAPKARRSVRLSDCPLARPASPALAQLQVPRILGTVFDPQRAGIPGATVTVTNLATNIARTAETDSEGNYVITPLDPGNYRVSAEIPASRRRCERTGADRRPGGSSRAHARLGGLSTEVQVRPKRRCSTPSPRRSAR